jgi:hypothetical protein
MQIALEYVVYVTSIGVCAYVSYKQGFTKGVEGCVMDLIHQKIIKREDITALKETYEDDEEY